MTTKKKTFLLPESDAKQLAHLSNAEGLPEVHILRKALKLYATLMEEISEGHIVTVSSPDRKVSKEIKIL